MSAWYNEIDEYAAQWLRNLIAAGHIADGVVDTRSISDVEPYDLRDFTQCHFFAGIGVWSYALRLAGWPDDREVWTGSCPCQPFSAAGRAGGFADERHLWPHWHHLIRERRPEAVFGEQVARKDGLAWLDLVHADLEGEGYAAAPFDLCAAGVGAPHIRQRLYFVAERLADSDLDGRSSSPGERLRTHAQHDAKSRGGAYRMDDTDDEGLEGLGRGHQTEGRQRQGAVRPATPASESLWVANANSAVTEQFAGQRTRPGKTTGRGAPSQSDRRGELAQEQSHPGPTNSFWRDADWLLCRDGKWRPVEPGTFPLAHGAPARVGRLRAYGNAIVPQAAAEMIAAFLEVRP